MLLSISLIPTQDLKVNSLLDFLFYLFPSFLSFFAFFLCLYFCFVWHSFLIGLTNLWNHLNFIHQSTQAIHGPIFSPSLRHFAKVNTLNNGQKSKQQSAQHLSNYQIFEKLFEVEDVGLSNCGWSPCDPELLTFNLVPESVSDSRIQKAHIFKMHKRPYIFYDLLKSDLEGPSFHWHITFQHTEQGFCKNSTNQYSMSGRWRNADLMERYKQQCGVYLQEKWPPHNINLKNLMYFKL